MFDILPAGYKFIFENESCVRMPVILSERMFCYGTVCEFPILDINLY